MARLLEVGLQPGHNWGPRILFAEDDFDIGILITEILRDEGFAVTSVQSGDEAAVTLDKESFHLLLTDVRMPGIKDGLDLAAYALRQNPRLPVVIVSGYVEELGARLNRIGRKVSLLRNLFW